MFITLSDEQRAKNLTAEPWVCVHNLDTPKMSWWRVTAGETKACVPQPDTNTGIAHDRAGMWRYLHAGTWVQLTPRQVREQFPDIWRRMVEDLGVTIADMPTGQEDAW